MTYTNCTIRRFKKDYSKELEVTEAILNEAIGLERLNREIEKAERESFSKGFYPQIRFYTNFYGTIEIDRIR